jgi:hypothetical protein
MKVLDVFKNKVKPAKGKVVMSKKGLVKEHRELVKTLKTGSRTDRLREAKEQNKELKGYMR